MRLAAKPWSLGDFKGCTGSVLPKRHASQFSDGGFDTH